MPIYELGKINEIPARDYHAKNPKQKKNILYENLLHINIQFS